MKNKILFIFIFNIFIGCSPQNKQLCDCPIKNQGERIFRFTIWDENDTVGRTQIETVNKNGIWRKLSKKNFYENY
jgi:hypothetical protein